MIYKVTGNLIMKEPGKAAIECSSGLAFELFISMGTYCVLPQEGANASLFTHFVSREDGVYLYGFSSIEEKKLFLLLNTVSKIGPKVALSILSNIAKDELAVAVVSGDVSRLSKIPGIGKKTAERIILELKDKLKIPTGVEHLSTLSTGVKNDVISALGNLGYKTSDCENAVIDLNDDDDFQTMFKKALIILAG